MYENYNIKEIRILVASSELEFKTEEEFRDYLRDELPNNCDGYYDFREKGIDVNDDRDILVLFWYKDKAVGCGVLHDKMLYDSKKNGIYSGALVFYPETIFNISDITINDIHRYSQIPKNVIQGSPKVDINALDKILNLISEKLKG